MTMGAQGGCGRYVSTREIKAKYSREGLERLFEIILRGSRLCTSSTQKVV